ncbi:MAG: phage late control D family protein [Erythrobacter sp.]|nr:phage late control D family protein [Erythrobacter sp.]
MTARIAHVRLALEGGADLAAKINPRLVRLSLSERREAEADELELVLHNADRKLAIPEAGRVLTLAMGWQSGDDVPLGLVDKGRFTVDEVGEEGPPDVVIIRARSADLTGLLRQRRTKSWKQTTLGAILGDIASRHNRTAKVAQQLASQPIAAIEQEGKSDMVFVRDLGRRFDAIATWKDGKLVFLPIGESATASGAPLGTVQLGKIDGWRWTFNQADRESYDGASAQWHDQNAGRRRTVTEGGENRRKLKRIYASESEARHAAKAATSRAARKPYRFTYELAIADPALQPDMRVSLSGFGERIARLNWLVTSIKMHFGSNGLTQFVELEGA